MADRMEQMIGAIESRQEAMNGRMSEFVEQIRQSVGNSQSESVEKMRAMMADLGSQVTNVVSQLDQQSKNAATGHEEQAKRMEEQLERFLKMTELSVLRYQRETSEQMQGGLNDLTNKASGLIASLQEQGGQAARAHAERQAQFSQQSEAVLGRLAADVERLAGEVQSGQPDNANCRGANGSHNPRYCGSDERRGGVR